MNRTQDIDEAIEIAIQKGWIKEEVDDRYDVEVWKKKYRIETLLSCPFCGGTPRHMHTSEDSWVDCPNCQASSKVFDAWHSADAAYLVLPVIHWNSTHEQPRFATEAKVQCLNETGQLDCEYWKLVDQRLAKNGVRL